MKKIKILLISLFIIPSILFADGKDGNGGNDTAASFTKYAKKAVETLKTQYNRDDRFKTLINKEDIENLETKLKEIKVFTVTYKLCIDSSDKECPSEDGFIAKNYEDTNYILVNKERWWKASNLERIQNAAHEILGLIGLERGNYNISSMLIADESVDLKIATEMICSFNLMKRNMLNLDTGLIDLGRSSLHKSIRVCNPCTKGFGLNLVTKKGKLTKDNIQVRGVVGPDYMDLEVNKVKLTKHGFVDEVTKKLVPIHNIIAGNGNSSRILKFDDYLLQVSCTLMDDL